MIEFEWDPGKARANFRKHGVSFVEAATTFGNPLSITFHDPDHSQAEDRFMIIGESGRNRLLIVAHACRGEKIQIISARKLTRKGRKSYEDEIRKRRP